MSLDPGKSENTKLLWKAIDKSINFFDTADLYDYGKNETLVGKALKGFRKNVLISTKVGNQWKADATGWEWNPGKKYILQAVEDSLKRLQTDYIDLYQLHGGTIEDPLDDIIEAFELLKKQGKIRYYGISSIRPNVIREYLNRSNIVSVMMQYSLLDRRPEEFCLGLLKENKIGVLVRGVLAKGLLVDKPSVSYLDHTSDQVMAATRAVSKITRRYNPAAGTALSFVLHHDSVTSAVIGFNTLNRLTDLVSGDLNFKLNSEEIEYLQNAAKSYTYNQYR